MNTNGEAIKLNRKRGVIATSVLLLLSVLALVLALSLGSTGFRLAELFRLIGGDDSGNTKGIILNIRLPRALLSYLVGGALSIAGCCLQGVFKNPMADSHVLGVSSGAGLGAAVAITFGVGISTLGIGSVAFCALLGGVAAVAIVYFLSRVNSRTSTSALLLSGIAISSLFSALTSAMMLIDRSNTEQILLWTLGSFGGATFEKVRFAAVTILPCAVICLFFARPLNIMLLGEEDARMLGVDYARTTRLLLFLTTILTACAVSVSGVIGFVGLILPHILRLIVGPDHRLLLPCSFLGGGIFLCLADMLARSVFPPLEVPVGVLSAICGVPFFLYLLRRQGKGGMA